MNYSTGIKKEVTIIGYERTEGKSDKCIKPDNKDGRYIINKFYYTEEIGEGREKDNYRTTGYGNRTGEFNLNSDNATELIDELEECGEISATIVGNYIGGQFRVSSIATG